MTNRNFLHDDIFADVRFAENNISDKIIAGKYVPFDFALMYPGGRLP